jgi:hypothetical protein
VGQNVYILEDTVMRMLITGPSGSGKTFLSEAWRTRAVNAFDADTIPDLCGWFDSAGRRVAFPDAADGSFLSTHKFLWDRQCLAGFLEQHVDVIVFGVAQNAFDMVELFQKVYFLLVPEGTLLQRLRDPTRRNPMGRTDYHREYAISWARRNEARARELGIPFLDGTLGPEEQYAEVFT